MALELKEFEFVRNFLQKSSAIVLDDEKRYLVESRLHPLARQEGFASVGELVMKLRSGRGNDLHQKVVEAMTTHETSFFRDSRPFEALKRIVLPEKILARNTTRQLRILCLGCSTGQEPYSLAMMIREDFPQLEKWQVSIEATDISTQILQKAREAVFTQVEISRGLPVNYLLKYFHRRDLNWQLTDEIRNMIAFRQLNLIDPWPAMPPADIVLLRNVLIYFDVETKKEILAKVRRMLQPDGYLLLGGAESTFGLDECFKRVELEKSSFYRLR